MTSMRRCGWLGGERISVIGGADIFALFLPLADRIELTEVLADIDGDTMHGRPAPARETGTRRSARIMRKRIRPFRFVTLERG